MDREGEGEAWRGRRLWWCFLDEEEDDILGLERLEEGDGLRALLRGEDGLGERRLEDSSSSLRASRACRGLRFGLTDRAVREDVDGE